MADELFNLSELSDILRRLGEDVRQGYVDKLVKNGRPTRENTLASTVSAYVEVKGTTYYVGLNLQEYWKYVEEGTKPHWPPPSAILHWIEVKPVIPRPGKDGRIPTPKQLAFLIGRKISEVGTKGTRDLKETTDALLGFYEQEIADALGRDAFRYIEKITAA